MSNKYDYSKVILNFDPKVATIKRLEGVPLDYKLDEGRMMTAEEFPQGLTFPMAEDSGDITTDVINNITRNLMVSGELRSFLKGIGFDESSIQFLPFSIKNKNGRVLNEPFFIANLLEAYNCVDLENSVIDIEDGVPDYEFMEVLQVDKTKIPDTARLFRLGENKSMLIIRDDLAQEIKDAGFTGLCLCPCGEELP